MLKRPETERVNLADFLLRRLHEVGCHHIFGVPGDFVLGFFNQILKSEVKYVGKNWKTHNKESHELLNYECVLFVNRRCHFFRYLQ